MNITIRTTDGSMYHSDEISEADMQKQIDEAWSKEPEFYKARNNKPTVDNAIDEMIDVLRNFKSLNFFSMTINGKDRYFNPVNITWAEVNR